MPDTALIEYLAQQDIRRLRTTDLVTEAEYAVYLLAEVKRQNDCEPGYRDYVVKRAQALKTELDRRIALLKWPAKQRGSIPLDFILQLKASARIDDIFDHFLGILCRPSGSRRMAYECPAHSDKHPSGVLYLEDNTYHCFQCGAHGDCFDALMAFKGLTFVQAVDAVAAHESLTLPKPPRDKGTVPL